MLYHRNPCHSYRSVPINLWLPFRARVCIFSNLFMFMEEKVVLALDRLMDMPINAGMSLDGSIPEHHKSSPNLQIWKEHARSCRLPVCSWSRQPLFWGTPSVCRPGHFQVVLASDRGWSCCSRLPIVHGTGVVRGRRVGRRFEDTQLDPAVANLVAGYVLTHWLLWL